MNLDALTNLLARMHDGRWQQIADEVVLNQPGQVAWNVRGYISSDEEGLQIVALWTPSHRRSGAHEVRMHLTGSPLEITQQIMARLPVLQRAVQLAFDEGMRSWHEHAPQ